MVEPCGALPRKCLFVYQLGGLSRGAETIPAGDYSVKIDERDLGLPLNSTLTEAPRGGSKLGWGGCTVGEANVLSLKLGRGGACLIICRIVGNAGGFGLDQISSSFRNTSNFICSMCPSCSVTIRIASSE
jgi:hypothetical protein